MASSGGYCVASVLHAQWIPAAPLRARWFSQHRQQSLSEHCRSTGQSCTCASLVALLGASSDAARNDDVRGATRRRGG